MARLFFPQRPYSQPTAAAATAKGPELPLEWRGLCIRPLQRADLDSRQRWPPYNDPLHLIWDMPRCSPRENDSWFTQITDGRHRLAYGVEDHVLELIGMLSLREVSWGQSARLGLALSSQHVGRGLGTACLRLFLPYFFLTQRFQKMVLDVAAANLRAVRCYHKVGFRQVGAFWQPLDGMLTPQVLERPEYASLRSLFRWSWGQTEALHYEMELTREDWRDSQGP